MATEGTKKAEDAAEPSLRLLHEAEALLKNLDVMGPAALEAALERRQKLVDALQPFDGGAAESQSARERTLRRVLEIDGLVIALARAKQEAIKERLSLINRSKSAVHSYDSCASLRRGGIPQR